MTDPITKKDYRECLNILIDDSIKNKSIDNLITMAFKTNNKVLVGKILTHPNAFFKKDNKAAIIYGINFYNNSAVMKLISKGISINYELETLQPLEFAVSKNNFVIVQRLIECGANLDAISAYSMTALMTAASKNYLETAALLINKGAKINDECGRPPLLIAAQANHKSMVKLLIEKGANINVIDPVYAFNVLSYAVLKCDLELIKFLLDYGADPNIKVINNIPLLILLIKNIPKENIELIIEVMKLLLKGSDIYHPRIKANINDVDGDGNNVLMCACLAHDNLTIVNFLIENGAELNLI